MRCWLFGLAALALAACGARPPAAEGRTVLSVAGLLHEGGEGFLAALAPRAFTFPADHGPHAGFRVEWWYFTGNLRTAEGRRFGYQLTFFRHQLRPMPLPRPSAWAAHEVYMAHFALTDAAGGAFHHAERFSRAALGLAGATAEPFRVWLEGWSAEAIAAEMPPLRLLAREGEVAIDLELSPGKPLVLQGEGGRSQKGPEPGNASYYYSLTRLPTRGAIVVGGRRFEVAGSSWMDREWSSSALSPGQVGWDWFAVQLDDGRDLMFYQLRHGDGHQDPASRGTLVAADGTARTLLPSELELTPRGSWQSPESGATYPAGWRLALPAEQVELTLTPLLPNQELRGTFIYWEGAVEVSGTEEGRPIRGVGYVEMTGYGESRAVLRGVR